MVETKSKINTFSKTKHIEILERNKFNAKELKSWENALFFSGEQKRNASI